MVALAHLLLARCGLITAAAAAQPVTTLKVHHFLPTGSTTHAKLIVPWCAKIEAESCRPAEVSDLSVDAAGGHGTTALRPGARRRRRCRLDPAWLQRRGRFPSMEVFELPFMISDAQSASRAAWQYYEKHGRVGIPRRAVPLLCTCTMPATCTPASGRCGRSMISAA